ncbi:MAG: radical SAM protein [Candidatus Melainabacteria bacterium]|nr:radical SAM protein [Candidatus Melainabacteria bacterium]
MKLLLTSVFGPYGVDDDFGRKLNVMELFHNQVTREQGLFSLRMNHPSFGLYLIAENLLTPTVVLDFPSIDDFEKEIGKGYDYIGISSIVANIGKVKRMCEIIRRLSPRSKIILGGHCVNISGVEKLVDVDLISTGEGVSYFRLLLGEPLDQPFRHPTIRSTLNRKIMGVPQPDDAAVLIPGLGCVNACSFCATSHHFQKRYIGYMSTGKEVFETLQNIEKEIQVDQFFVLDENFLKSRQRAEELLEEMEKAGKYYHLGVFSSAETIDAVGVEFMVKLGIDFVWIGVESKRHVFAKTKGIDMKAMIAELRSYGIQVLGSAILFLDHHDRDTIQEDIDFAIDLNTDFLQFMNLGPLPGTSLYEKLEEEGRILHELPFKEWHGQDLLWFRHDSFENTEAPSILKEAFLTDYCRQGPSLLRLADTSLRGYRTIRNHSDPRIRGFTERLKKRCLAFRPIFEAARIYAENDKTLELLNYLDTEYRREFGSISLADRLAGSIVVILAFLARVKLERGFMPQPPRRRETYRLNAIARPLRRIRDTDKDQNVLVERP